MKAYTLVLAFYAASIYSAKLVAKQNTCPEDNCWRAVWGNTQDLHALVRVIEECESHLTTRVATYTYSLATITVVAETTATAVVSCSPTLTSNTASDLSRSPSSLPGFSFPTPTPVAARLVGNLKARQTAALSYSITTIIGLTPTYAREPCSNTDAVDLYASACSCEGIVSSSINVNGPSTILTSTATLTLTSTVTTTASCSSSIVVTLSHSSSTTVTTVTFSSPISTGTGTGTISVPSSSLISSSSTTNLNISTTPSTTLSSTATTSNTTLTSSSTPTPTCASPGYILCNSTCLDAATDAQHCGSCGNRCGDGLVCFNGVCARRPIDAPCDTNCTYRRECNRGIGGVDCACARDPDGYGVCFNANEYQCLSTTPKCRATTDCKLGGVCIKSICAEAPSACSNTTAPEADGICVTSMGCGAQGPISLGALLRVGEEQQRKRMVGEFNW